MALQLIYFMGFGRAFVIGMKAATGDPSSEIYQLARKTFNNAGREVIDYKVPGKDRFVSENKATSFAQLKDLKRHPGQTGAIDSHTGPEKKDKLINIVYYPAFSASDDLNFNLVRASWYLSCIPDSRVYIHAPYSPNRLNCFDYYDPACENFYQQMLNNKQLDFQRDCSREALEESLAGADIVICWGDGSSTDSKLGLPAYDELISAGKVIYCVDPRQRMESSKYINISMETCALQAETTEKNQQKFKQLIQRFQGSENAYLFATGPSSGAYGNYKYNQASSVVIICNSIINDEQMLAELKPDILVFADPIFHFGCSTYAQAFREKLLDVCSRYAFKILIPIKYYTIFCYHLPELEERIIGIPYIVDEPINFDLEKKFYLKTFDNILTFMMLPIAGSLAKKIYVIGCDGRPLKEDDYFWVHNDKVQFAGEMAAIQKAHPSFFKTDYNEYYLRHCENLEKWALKLEAAGHELCSMWGSFIPALSSRPGIPETPSGGIRVSICPGLSSVSDPEFDLHGLATAATDDLSIVLAASDVCINPIEFFVVPVFSTAVSAFRNNYDQQEIQLLLDELAPITERLLNSTGMNVILKFEMPAGDVTYLDALDPLFSAFSDRVTLSINLAYIVEDYDVETDRFRSNALIYEKILQQEYLQQRLWLSVFVSGQEAQDIIMKKTGIKIAKGLNRGQ